MRGRHADDALMMFNTTVNLHLSSQHLWMSPTNASEGKRNKKRAPFITDAGSRVPAAWETKPDPRPNELAVWGRLNLFPHEAQPGERFSWA